MATKITLYRLNDQWITVSGLTNGRTGLPITDCTLTGTVYDSTGTAVDGATGLTFAYDTPSGTYVAQVTNALVDIAGTYSMILTGVEDGLNLVATVAVSIKDRVL